MRESHPLLSPERLRTPVCTSPANPLAACEINTSACDWMRNEEASWANLHVTQAELADLDRICPAKCGCRGVESHESAAAAPRQGGQHRIGHLAVSVGRFEIDLIALDRTDVIVPKMVTSDSPQCPENAHGLADAARCGDHSAVPETRMKLASALGEVPQTNMPNPANQARGRT